MQTSLKRAMYQLALVFLLLAVYGATLGHGFVWDDTSIIVHNRMLEELANIPRFFLTEDNLLGDPSGYYRPVTYISFALERAVWGLNPLGYHLTNLLLLIGVVLLFFAVVKALFKNERLAFIAALVLALHPIAGETVNFLSGGRNTLLCAFFTLLSLHFYLKKRPVGALACFTAAIFSKEFGLLLPLIFLWCDRRVFHERVRIRGYLPYAGVVAGYLVLRSFAVQKANFLSQMNFSDAAQAPYLAVRFALNMLWPFQLKTLYQVAPSGAAEIGCAVIVIVAAVAVYLFRKHDEVLLASLWFILFLLPVLNIVPLQSTSPMADRYAYFSLMGFALLVAFAVCRCQLRMLVAGGVALCALYAGLDVRGNGFWKSDLAFFTRMTEDAPARFTGFQNLGMLHYRNGDLPRAMHYLQLSDAKPDVTINYLICNSFIYWKANRLAEAEAALRRAAELQPGDPEASLWLMMLGQEKGDPVLASSSLENVKGMTDPDALRGDRGVQLCRIGEKYLAMNLYRDAEIFFWMALKVNPEAVPALVDMGSLKAEEGDFGDAIRYLKGALAIDPLNAAARSNLSLVYRMLQRGAAPAAG